MIALSDWFGRARNPELETLAHARLRPLAPQGSAVLIGSDVLDSSQLEHSARDSPERTALNKSSEPKPLDEPTGRIIRWSPGRNGAVLVLLVAVVALVLAGVGLWRLRKEPDTVTVSQETSVPEKAPSSSEELIIAVSGKVQRPGLVHVKPGARVADAIAAAGGILPATDFGTLNLARKLRDGELIVVGEQSTPNNSSESAGASGDSEEDGDLIDLNTADVSELDQLPGVGPVLAQRIVDYREKHGGFSTVEELREVDGIGESRFNDLREQVTV